MTPSEKLVLTALSFYGEAETAGHGSNPTILGWIKKFFRSSASDDSTTPWCGIFMAQVFGTCGFPAPSVPARASSWGDVGTAVLTKDLQLGDVLVFDREGGMHVALFISMQRGVIQCLGGNQGNRVCIAPHDLSKLRHARRIRAEQV